MKILSIDIGAKTQDILLYDDSLKLENCIKLVLPTPAMIFRKEIIEATDDLFIKGDTIGGGMLSRAIKEHAKKHEVFMTKDAACTIRDDVDVVNKKVFIKDSKNTNRFLDGYGKDRVVTIPDIAINPIKKWLDIIAGYVMAGL